MQRRLSSLLRRRCKHGDAVFELDFEFESESELIFELDNLEHLKNNDLEHLKEHVTNVTL